MSYLQDERRFNFNSNLFILNKIENDIRTEMLRRKLTSKQSENFPLDHYKKMLDKVSMNNKGFNLYCGLAGLAAFHSYRIFSSKVLFSEMGNKAFMHTAYCLGVGIGVGFILGSFLGRDLKVSREERKLRKQLDQMLSMKK